MAENQLDGNVIGVSFDGTGFGDDGNIWGGEFFKGGYYGFERVGHLEYVMMPGSDSAVKHPWKMALGYLFNANLTNLVQESKANICSENRLSLSGISQDDIDFVINMLKRKLNCPQTSSVGRFFDAVSALLEIKTDISYEGQAAIELENYAVDQNPEPYVIEFSEQNNPSRIMKASFSDSSIDANKERFIAKTSCILKQIVKDIQDCQSIECISSRFHCTIADIVLQGCEIIRNSSGINSVVLSGGVFQNMTLLKMSVDRLREHGFLVYTHSEVPANDGGIALGQAMMALARSVTNPRD